MAITPVATVQGEFDRWTQSTFHFLGLLVVFCFFILTLDLV